MTTHIRKVVIEVLELTRGNEYEPKDTWWWNDDVQKTISEKKKCYKRLHHHRNDENIQKYKKKQKKREKNYERSKKSDIYRAVLKKNMKEGKNDVYKMTKF
jgi:dipeptidase